jgi:gamma-glutamyltranspeptidase/glutathione hydrolase
VVQPFWTGIGGDLFCLVADRSDIVAFNGSGPAPSRLDAEVCLRAAATGAAPVMPAWMADDFPATLPDKSALAVTVPGVVDGWVQLAERYGRLPLSRTLEPARTLAAQGFPVGRIAARHWRAASGRLRPGSPFAPVVRAGQRLSNPQLAGSLEDIGRGGRSGHYEGAWAKEAVEVVTNDGGALASDDLATYAGEWTVPIRGRFRGLEVLQHPPNGQGAAVLAALALLDQEPPRADAGPGEQLARIMVAIRQGMRLAHRHVADPRAATVPEFWAALAARDTGRDTVYTAAVADGMAVSLITSVFHQFGSGLTAGGAALQNRGLGFSLDPTSPNCIGPDKRPFHTIIPAMVRDRGRPWAVLGVVGGPMQPQGQVQVLAHMVERGLDPQAALDEPRARWLGGDMVAVEAGGQPEIIPSLRNAGFQVLDPGLPLGEFGAGQVIRVHPDGWLEGGADGRRDGVAFGF